MSPQSASIRLSREHKGRKRREPVWVARCRITGRDSAKVLGKTWTKRSRPPVGYLTRSQAEEALARLLLVQGAAVKASSGPTFGEVADAYLANLVGRVKTRSFRASTLSTYRNIVARDLRPLRNGRPIAGITAAEVAEFHRRVVARGRRRARSIRRVRSCTGSSRSPSSGSGSSRMSRWPSSAPR